MLFQFLSQCINYLATTKNVINFRMSWSHSFQRWNTGMALVLAYLLPHPTPVPPLTSHLAGGGYGYTNITPVSDRPPKLTQWVLSAELVNGWLFFIARLSRSRWTRKTQSSFRCVSSHFLFDTSVFSHWYFIVPPQGTRLKNTHEQGVKI